jgi:hypothetical protein
VAADTEEDLMPRRSAVLAALALTLSAPALAQAAPARLSEPALREAMRKLWEDHVTYTAFFYTAVIDGTDAGPIAARLLRNQDELGDAVKPFYGDAAGAQLASLLRDHILVAADLVKAAKAGDAKAREDAARRWQLNADAIAGFLASANPHWPRQVLDDMLRAHLAITVDAVVARLSGDAAAAVAAYDRGHLHILALADALSAGLVKQFPDRFLARL